MKRGTPDHPKVALLAYGLGCAKPTAVGILELLWHYTARYAPQGDVGRWPDEHIAAAVGWTEDPARLIGTLVKVGWLDHSAEHRLVVHDWHDHADDTTRKYLGRKKKPFLSKPPGRSRHVRTSPSRIRDAVAVAVAVPLPGLAKPAPEPPPSPEPLGDDGAAPPPPDPPDFDRSAVVARGHAAIREIRTEQGKAGQQVEEPGEILKRCSELRSGWWLTDTRFSTAPAEYLTRTVDRLERELRRYRRSRASPNEPTEQEQALYDRREEQARAFLAWWAAHPSAGEVAPGRPAMIGAAFGAWATEQEIPQSWARAEVFAEAQRQHAARASEGT